VTTNPARLRVSPTVYVTFAGSEVTAVESSTAALTVTLKVVVLVMLASMYVTVTVVDPAVDSTDPAAGDVVYPVTAAVEPLLYVAVTTIPVRSRVLPAAYDILVGIVVTAMESRATAFTVTLKVVVFVMPPSMYETVTAVNPTTDSVDPAAGDVVYPITAAVELLLYVAVTTIPVRSRVSPT